MQNVTECLTGIPPIAERDLGQRYTTVCDPRLNARKTKEIARRVASCAAPTGPASPQERKGNDQHSAIGKINKKGPRQVVAGPAE